MQCTVLMALLSPITHLLAQPTSAVVATTQGQLNDGTDYRIDMPSNWNGAVLIGLDYAGRGNPLEGDQNATNRHLLAQGFAMAGTTRKVTGWAIHQAARNAVQTLDIFERQYGKPKFAIEYGSSQGGHTAAVSVQTYPDRWSGAVVQCGGLSGSVGQWQGKLDALFVAKALLAPQSQLPVTQVPKDFETTALPAWRQVLSDAQKTAQGRARIALAATIAQLPEWSQTQKPRPQIEDWAARQAGLYDSLMVGVSLVGQAMSSRLQVETLSGGNISANAGVDYAALLQRADVHGLIPKLYEAAHLDLQSDLKALAQAPRLTADPKALAYVASGIFNGDLNVPVITVNGIGDAISVVASQSAYEEAVKAAGKSAQLRQVYTASAGHCGFTPAESVAAINTLMHRLQTGQWEGTSAQSMNDRAQSAQLGLSRFIDYIPAPYLRPYSRCDLARDLQGTHWLESATLAQALTTCRHP